MFKICLVANTDWYLYNFRLSLAQELQRRGHTVVLVSPPGRNTAHLQEAGFLWVPWVLGRQSLAPWKEAAALARLAHIYRVEKPDLAHHFTIKPVLYGSLAAQVAGVKGSANSITGLGYIFLGRDRRSRLLKRLVEPFYRYVLKGRGRAAIFENDSDRQYFIRSGLAAADRSWLIEGAGVDASRFTPLPEPDGPPVVVLPARMLWDKGAGVFVEAARYLKDKVSARFALVGEPDPGNPASIPEETLRQWVSEGFVEWWGWQHDMRTVYADCHIVCLPSFGEGTPNVLLEAAACARPIVASDVQGCRDVVKHGYNGLLAPPRDAIALAGALEALINDKGLRDTMGAAGRQLILEKYTSQQINDATISVYHTLVKVDKVSESSPHSV